MQKAQTRLLGFPLLPALLAAACSLALLWAESARADHSLGYPCLQCHALRSTKVKVGTRNIFTERIDPYSLYTQYWYCGTAFSGGQPLDCSYCHSEGTDIGLEIGWDRGGTAGAASSAHPVDVIGPSTSYGTKTVPGFTGRLKCSDCHNADVSPSNPFCGKDAEDGYPNHKNLSGVTADTGTNQRTGAAAHLDPSYKYGDKDTDTTYGVDWTAATFTGSNVPLCFKCHTDIKAKYDAPNGGHNIRSRADDTANQNGTLTKKLGCYNCHDPHASTDNPDTTDVTEGNAALIVTRAVGYPHTPYGTSYTGGNLPPVGYTGSNDRVVCYGCHSGYVVGGQTLSDVLDTPTFNPRFPFHQNAHADVASSGNCLQKNNGCHQDVHNTDIYRCLDCHSTAVTSAMTAPPARLVAVAHVDDDFGRTAEGVGKVLHGDLWSQHSVRYDDDPTVADDNLALDLSDPTVNECLACHRVRAGTTLSGRRPMVWVGSLLSGTAYGRPSAGPAGWSNREALAYYDPFCLSCHDGGYPRFRGDLPAPDVGRYFSTDGHGRTTGFSPPSSNGAPKIPCLECHLYHGSSAYKLLPGDRLAGQARVVKGFAYSPLTTGTVFPIGDNTDSRKIDYTDYTDKGGTPDNPTLYNSRLSGRTKNDLRSGYLSNYTVNWSTIRGDTPRNPAGIWTPFGTSGDVRPNTQNSNRSLDCNQDATDARNTTTPKIGFCNTCHFYNNSTDGTSSSYGRIYTHEGHVGGLECDGSPSGSKRNFFKDCAECHDPHGSGSSTNANFFMIRGKIKHGKTENLTDAQNSSNWTEVNFYASGANPVPPYDLDKTNNSEHLCNVCHSGLLWSNLDPGEDTADHALGQRCTQCHPHSE